MKRKAPKLSIRQQEVLDLMASGWQLGMSSAGRYGYRAWLQKGGCGYGGESKDVSVATVHALSSRSLIIMDKDQFPTQTYKLAEAK